MTSIGKDTIYPDSKRYAKLYQFDSTGSLLSIHFSQPEYSDRPDYFIVDTFCYDNRRKIISVQHNVRPVKITGQKSYINSSQWNSTYVYHGDTLYFIRTKYSDRIVNRTTFFDDNGLPRETMLGTFKDNSSETDIFNYSYDNFKTPACAR